MDKSAIFSDVTRRSALRRANNLPPLDVHAEYAHQVSLAQQREYQASCDANSDVRETIRQHVLAELRAQHGADFGQTMGGRWAVGELTRKRFAAFMAAKLGAAPERPAAGRNEIIYGGGETQRT